MVKRIVIAYSLLLYPVLAQVGTRFNSPVGLLSYTDNGNPTCSSSSLPTASSNSNSLAVVKNTAGSTVNQCWSNGTSWVSVTGGGLTNPLTLPNQMITSTTAGAPSPVNFVVNPESYGAKHDGQQYTDGNITASAAVLSSTSQYTFTSADIGKNVSVVGAGAAGVVLVTTVSSVSGGNATLAANASTTITSALFSLWKTDDTAFIQSAITAAAANAGGGYGEVYFPCGNYALATVSTGTPSGFYYLLMGSNTALVGQTRDCVTLMPVNYQSQTHVRTIAIGPPTTLNTNPWQETNYVAQQTFYPINATTQGTYSFTLSNPTASSTCTGGTAINCFHKGDYVQLENVGASSTLSSGVSSSTPGMTDTIVLAATTGFPTSYPFYVLVNYVEIMQVTSLASGTTYNVTRGVLSSPAPAASMGSAVQLWGDVFANEPARVIGVNTGSGAVTLTTPLAQSYATAVVSNVTTVGTGTAVGVAVNDSIFNITVLGYWAVAPTNTFNVRVEGSRLIADTCTFTPASIQVLPIAAVRGIKFDGNTVTNNCSTPAGLFALTSRNTYDAEMSNNIINAQGVAFTEHATHVKAINNTFNLQSNAAFSVIFGVQGYDQTISDNTINATAMAGAGAVVSDCSGCTSGFQGKITFANNHVSCNNSTTATASYCIQTVLPDTVLSGNTVDNGGAFPWMLQVGISSALTSPAQPSQTIIGNTFKGIGGGGHTAISVSYAGGFDGLTFTGNTVAANGSGAGITAIGIATPGSPNGGVGRITGNSIDPSFGTVLSWTASSHPGIVTDLVPLPSSQGGSGVNNTATETLGTSNHNWATLATGIVKNTTTTGALSAAASADVVGLFSGGAGCTGTNYLAANGTCQTASGGGATTALDNLASVNINSALLFQTGIDIGSATKPLRNLYLSGSGTYGTNYTEFTGTPTSTRTITVPDATDTLSLLGATQTFTGINTISTSGAASTPAFNFTGAWYAAGTTTTNTPLLNIQQGGASAATGWGANGTAVGVICTDGNPNVLDIHQSAGNSLASIKCTGASSFTSVLVSGGITNTSADIIQAAANSYTWSGRDKLGSPADGTLSITNNAGTGFTRVTLGPNASTSFIGLGVTTQANPILLLRDANGGNTATLDAGLGISFATVAGGLSLHAGSNARVGSGTLSGGTVAISNTSVTANSKVFVVDTSSGSLANVGSLVVVSKTASTGFTVNSTNVLDASTFDYFIIETN